MGSYYLLNPDYALRGWKLLPYAVQPVQSGVTEFMDKRRWDLLIKCDGQTEVDIDALEDGDREVFDKWLSGFLIFECPKGSELWPHQRYIYYPTRFKESVHWSITGKCNYKCKHCFMSAPHAAQGEPTWDELMIMLDSFVRCGIKRVTLTGGEPLVRRDFWDLVDEIHRKGINIDIIFSNGWLMNDEFFAQLDKRGMRPAIQFSFDGVGCHDWLRGVDGAEKAVTDAFEKCRERGIKTFAAMVMFKDNKDKIGETVRTLAKHGVSGLKICNAFPQGEWINYPDHYLTTAEMFQAYLDYIPEFIADGMPMSLELGGFFNYSKDSDEISATSDKRVPEDKFSKVFMCTSVRRSMYVSPQGNVLPCMSMVGTPVEDRFPNLLDQPLEEILDSSSLYMDIVNYRISDYLEHNPECRECEYKASCCGGCRAVALRDTPDDYLAPDLVICEYYKGGWREKKDKLLEDLLKR